MSTHNLRCFKETTYYLSIITNTHLNCLTSLSHVYFSGLFQLRCEMGIDMWYFRSGAVIKPTLYFNSPLSMTFNIDPVKQKFIVTFKDEVSCSMINNLSLVMRKPTFYICENKDADQLRSNREADQRLCFRYTDSTIPLFPKSEISSL